MWDRDRSAHHQRHIKRIHKLFASHTRFGAFSDVISDAIVATEDDRTGQAHQLLGLLVERAILISLGIERKESFDAQMTTAEKLFIHLRAITIKLVHPRIPFKPFLRLRRQMYHTQRHRSNSCRRTAGATVLTDIGPHVFMQPPKTSL